MAGIAAVRAVHAQEYTAAADSSVSFKPVFMLFDVDSDGFISRGELTSMLAGMYRVLAASQGPEWPYGDTAALADSTAALALQQADTNRDGVISYPEFVAWVTDPANADTSGPITRMAAMFLQEVGEEEEEEEEEEEDEAVAGMVQAAPVPAISPTSVDVAEAAADEEAAVDGEEVDSSSDDGDVDPQAMGVPAALQGRVSAALAPLSKALRLSKLNPGHVFTLLRSYASVVGAESASSGKGLALTQEQFCEGMLVVLGRLLPQGTFRATDATTSTLAKLFDRLDTNGDGLADMHELGAALSCLCGGSRDDKVEAAFELFDADGDGELSLEEVENFFVAVFRLMAATPSLSAMLADEGFTPAQLGQTTAQAAFEEADRDGDGVISQEEFRAWYAAGVAPGALASNSPASSGRPGLAVDTTAATVDDDADTEPGMVSPLASSRVQLAQRTRSLAAMRGVTLLGDVPLSRVLAQAAAAASAHDGVLTRDAFSAVFAQYLRSDSEEASMEGSMLLHTLFGLFDADGNGEVDAAELSAGLSVLCGGEAHSKARAAFELFDADGDGFISMSEMVAYLTSVFRVMTHLDEEAASALPSGVTVAQLARSTAKAAFEAADANEDGQLSFEEFLSWFDSGAAADLQTPLAMTSLQELRSRASLDAISLPTLLHHFRQHADGFTGTLDMPAFTAAVAAASQAATGSPLQPKDLGRLRLLLSQIFDAFVESSERKPPAGLPGRVGYRSLAIGLTVLCGGGSGSAGDRVKAVFDLLDANGDGSISEEECRNYLLALFTVLFAIQPDMVEALRQRLGTTPTPALLAGATTESVFAEADLNHDGKLSRGEFLNWVMSAGGNVFMAAVPHVPPGKPAGETAPEAPAQPSPPLRLQDLKTLTTMLEQPMREVIETLARNTDKGGLLSKSAFAQALHSMLRAPVRAAVEAPEGVRTERGLDVAGTRAAVKRLSTNLFTLFDTSGDGVLDFTELSCGISALLAAPQSEKIGLVFRLFDVDGSGYISRTEMESFLTAYFTCLLATQPHARADLAEQILGHPPRKGAGASAEVLAVALTNRAFAEADADHDQQLSLEEFQEWYASELGHSMEVAAKSVTTQVNLLGAATGGSSLISSMGVEELARVTGLESMDHNQVLSAFRDAAGGRQWLSRGAFNKAMLRVMAKAHLSDVDRAKGRLMLPRLFGIFDENEDGVVDFAEVAAGLQLLSGDCLRQAGPEASARRVASAFELFDLNGDGMIEVGEMQAYLSAVFRVLLAANPEQAAAIAQANGVPQDKLSATELARATAEQAFAEADTDGDGLISQDEFASWLSEVNGTSGELSTAQVVAGAAEVGLASAPGPNPKLASQDAAWAVRETQRLTSVAEEPLMDVLNAFAENASADGCLDLPAFRDAMSRFLRPGADEHEEAVLFNIALPEVFTAFDADEDGRVDFAELSAGMAVLGEGSDDEKIDAAFALFDADGDGSITPEEMTMFLEGTFRMVYARDPTVAASVGGLGPAELAAATTANVFAVADTRHDNKLSKAEFAAWFRAQSMGVDAADSAAAPPPQPSAPPPEPAGATTVPPPRSAGPLTHDDAGAPGEAVPGTGLKRLPYHRNLANMPGWMALAEARRVMHLEQARLGPVLAHFSEFADAEGKLTRRAFRNAFGEYVADARARGAVVSGDPVSEEHIHALVDALFDQFDEDGAGVVSAQELKGGLTHLVGRATATDRVNAAFDIYDVDGDGYLTAWELNNYLTHVFKAAEAVAEDGGAWGGLSPEALAQRCTKQVLQAAGAAGRISRAAFHHWYETSELLGGASSSDVQVQEQLLAAAEVKPSTISLTELREVSCLPEFSVAEALDIFLQHADSQGHLTRAAFNAAMDRFTPHHTEQSSSGLAVVQGRDEADAAGHAFVRAHIFDVVDTEGQGLVDVRHLVAGLSVLCGGEHDSRVRAAFAFIDADNDGVISKEELQAYLAGVYRLVQSTDGDDAMPDDVSAQEMAVAATEECFAHADKDHDGRLTVDELIAWYDETQSGDGADQATAELGQLVVSAAAPEAWLTLEEVKRLTGLQHRRLPEVLDMLADATDERGLLGRSAFHTVFEALVRQHESQGLQAGLVPTGPGGALRRAEGPLDATVAAKMPRAVRAYAHAGRSAVEAHRTHLILDRLFDLFDADDSDAVDFTELSGGLSVLCGGDHHERARAVFELFDLHHTGGISQDELFMFLTSTFKVLLRADPRAAPNLLGRTPEELAVATVRHVFAEADLDHDGKLTFPEFARWYGTPSPTQTAFVAATNAIAPRGTAPPPVPPAAGSARVALPSGPVYSSMKAAAAAEELPPADELRSRLGLDAVNVSELFSILRENAHRDNGRLVLHRDRFRRALALIASLAGSLHASNKESFDTLCEHVYTAFDADGNGVLDFAEICAAFTVYCAGSVDDKVAAAFEAYDADGDGFISREEMYDYLVTLFRAMLSTGAGGGVAAGATPEAIAMATVEEAFRTADTNQDGQLSFEEFRAWYSSTEQSAVVSV